MGLSHLVMALLHLACRTALSVFSHVLQAPKVSYDSLCTTSAMKVGSENTVKAAVCMFSYLGA